MRASQLPELSASRCTAELAAATQNPTPGATCHLRRAAAAAVRSDVCELVQVMRRLSGSGCAVPQDL